MFREAVPGWCSACSCLPPVGRMFTAGWCLGFCSPAGKGVAMVVGVGTTAAAASWLLARVRRSILIAGWPQNPWDVLALPLGRLEAEPHLESFPTTTRFRAGKSRLLRHLDALRTPDGHHLWPDPCPLVACLAAGWWSGVVFAVSPLA